MRKFHGILIVDDMPSALKVLYEILGAEGYTVRPANGGVAALAAVEAELPELILIDLLMPGMDGFEVCRRLKSRDDSRDIPVLFLSGSTTAEERIAALNLGAVDFITKPFQREELLARVRTHLELFRLRQTLEAQVREQTEQLRTANERLQAELQAREKLEERLRQSEKLEAIGQLAGGIAHDFNNQLAAILGFSEMLTNRIEHPHLRRYAENIMNASRGAAELTKQLLAFARKGKFVSKDIEIHAVIRDVAALLQHSLDKRINLTLRLTAEPDRTNGDPTLIQNALLNLALNARDAMPDGGELIFDTRIATLTDKSFDFEIEGGRYLQISVTDSGTGMDADIRKHIFEPFFTTKPQGKGTGLGLAAVYGTVKSHRGAISVYSEPGRGTTFRVYLPLLEAAVAAAASPAAEPPRVCHARILLVDDEELLREMGMEMLMLLGAEVATCSNGEEAVAYYREHASEIDLVILDMMMPKLSGRETFLAMQKIDPDVRALLVSGYSLNGEAQGILDLGVRGFIQKPFEVGELSRMVALALPSHAKLEATKSP